MKLFKNILKKKEENIEFVTKSIFEFKEDIHAFWNRTQKLPFLKRRKLRKLYKQVYALKGEKENEIQNV